MDTLLVLVADTYHTDAARALLGALQRSARHVGRKVQVVLFPLASFAPEVLSGREEVVLLLLEKQRRVAEHLIGSWNELSRTRRNPHPALPLMVREEAAIPWNVSGERLHPTVSVDLRDIYWEHGGAVHLHPQAEEKVTDAIHALCRHPTDDTWTTALWDDSRPCASRSFAEA